MKSKSDITMKELQKKAKEAQEFSEDYGWFIIIDENESSHDNEVIYKKKSKIASHHFESKNDESDESNYIENPNYYYDCFNNGFNNDYNTINRSYYSNQTCLPVIQNSVKTLVKHRNSINLKLLGYSTATLISIIITYIVLFMITC